MSSKRCPSLAAALGDPALYVKRDDQTGLAFGGNKARTLEFIFADVVAEDSDIIITTGAVDGFHVDHDIVVASDG